MIYVVVRNSWDYTEVIGVYDKKELADKVLEFNKEYCIQECQLNKLTDEGMSDVFDYITSLKQKLNIEEEN